MSTRNYLVLSDDMTLTNKADYRLTALAAGYERCGVKGIGNVNADIPGLQAIPAADKTARINAIKAFISQGVTPKSIDQRELMPLTDLVVPAAQDSWLTAALAVVGTAYTCLNAVAAPQLLTGKLMVCYAVSVESVSAIMPVSRLTFRRGGAVGNIQALFDMEPMGVRLEQDAFFSEPVVIDPQDIFAIQALCRVATGISERVHVHNFLFESAGTVVA